MNTKNQQPVRLLSTQEVAKIVGCAPKTIVRWAELGKYDFPLPAIEGGPGASKRWHSRDVEAWLESIRTR